MTTTRHERTIETAVQEGWTRKYSSTDPQSRDKLIGTGRSFVVVDTVGAGLGEMVLIVQGSSARLTPETEKLPVDATIIGIVDSVHVENKTVFSAREE